MEIRHGRVSQAESGLAHQATPIDTQRDSSIKAIPEKDEVPLIMKGGSLPPSKLRVLVEQ